MNLNIVHVFTKDDLECAVNDGYETINDIPVDEYDFNWDYAQTALVDIDKYHVIMWNDNIHTNIEDDINNFIKGLRYGGIEVNVLETIMMDTELTDICTGARY